VERGRRDLPPVGLTYPSLENQEKKLTEKKLRRGAIQTYQRKGNGDPSSPKKKGRKKGGRRQGGEGGWGKKDIASTRSKAPKRHHRPSKKIRGVKKIYDTEESPSGNGERGRPPQERKNRSTFDGREPSLRRTQSR